MGWKCICAHRLLITLRYRVSWAHALTCMAGFCFHTSQVDPASTSCSSNYVFHVKCSFCFLSPLEGRDHIFLSFSAPSMLCSLFTSVSLARHIALCFPSFARAGESPLESNQSWHPRRPTCTAAQDLSRGPTSGFWTLLS